MSIVAETATLAHGFTMADVERAARRATGASGTGATMMSSSDRFEAAWFGIIEYLYDNDEFEIEPTHQYLVGVGVGAVRNLAEKAYQHRGIDRHASEVRPSFAKFWVRPGGAHEDFTDRLVERLALPQILSLLTADEYEALSALAVYEKEEYAADAIRISTYLLRARIKRARAKITANWYAPDHPPTQKHDYLQACKHGHPREAGWVRGQRCRKCTRSGNSRSYYKHKRPSATGEDSD
jgi:hypothetical protein